MSGSRVHMGRLGLSVAAVLLIAACGGSASVTPSSVSVTPSPVAPSPVAPSSGSASSATPSESTGAWVTVTSANGGYSVEMPGTPTSSVQEAQTEVGLIELHVDLLQDANGAYGATWGDYPPGSVSGADPAEVLQGGQDGAIENVNGTLIEAAPIEIQGVPGRAFSASIDGGTYYARIFIKGDRLVQLGVVVATDAPGYDPERFFDSLRFN